MKQRTINSKQTVVDVSVKALLGTKLGMTQLWGEAGCVTPITVVRVDTNAVTQIYTPETDGYSAVQLTSGELKVKNTTKPLQGHFDKAGVASRRKLVEIRTPDAAGYELGQEPTTDLSGIRQRVDVVGTSKDKGFAGVMKRHGFPGASASYGAHRNHRKPGLIGACVTPSRVFHGLRMAGRMGKDHVTVLNLPVHAVDIEKGIILSVGAVPGNKDGTIVVRTVVERA